MIKNFLKFGVAAGSAVFLFLLLVSAGRVLGPEDFGRFSFALAFVLFFDPILDPGFYHLLIREVSRRKEEGGRYLIHALSWKIIAAPLIFVASRLIVPRIDPSPATLTAVYLIAASQVLKSIKDTFRATYIASERFEREMISLGVERIALLLVGGFALYGGYGLHGLCLAFLIVRVFDVVLAWLLSRGLVGELTFNFDRNFLLTMLTAGIPIGAYYVTANLYSYLDTVMLAAMRGNADVGLYNAAYRVYEGLAVVPLVISTVLMPRMSRHHDNDPTAFGSIFGGGIKYAFGIGVLIGGNGLLMAPLVIRTCFGTDYLSAVVALRILAVGFPIVFSLNFLNTALISMNRSKAVFLSAAVGLMLNGALNMVLIPRFTQNGAAAATVIVETILFVALSIYMRKQISTVAKQMFGSPLLAAALGAFAVYATASWGLLSQIVAGNLVFLTTVWLLGFVAAPERAAIMASLSPFLKKSS